MRCFTLWAWAVSMGVVGVAQLFRTEIEHVVGATYIVGAATLAVSLLFRVRVGVVTGLGILSASFAARAIAGLAIEGSPWHSRAIILSTWGMAALLAYNHARRVAGDG